METALELDIDISTDDLVTADDEALITSFILCTAGCTSKGGGSLCSWCC
nr:gallidermin/nisin family lantibiotic [Actinomyces sp. UMB0138]